MWILGLFKFTKSWNVGSKVWVKSTHSAVLIVVIGPTMDNLSYVSPRKSNIRIKEGENSISPHMFICILCDRFIFSSRFYEQYLQVLLRHLSLRLLYVF